MLQSYGVLGLAPCHCTLQAHAHAHADTHSWIEPFSPDVGRNYHLIFLSYFSTSRSTSRFTDVLHFDCLDLVEFPSCHSVTHEQLFLVRETASSLPSSHVP